MRGVGLEGRVTWKGGKGKRRGSERRKYGRIGRRRGARKKRKRT